MRFFDYKISQRLLNLGVVVSPVDFFFTDLRPSKTHISKCFYYYTEKSSEELEIYYKNSNSGPLPYSVPESVVKNWQGSKLFKAVSSLDFLDGPFAKGNCKKLFGSFFYKYHVLRAMQTYDFVKYVSDYIYK